MLYRLAILAALAVGVSCAPKAIDPTPPPPEAQESPHGQLTLVIDRDLPLCHKDALLAATAWWEQIVPERQIFRTVRWFDEQDWHTLRAGHVYWLDGSTLLDEATNGRATWISRTGEQEPIELGVVAVAADCAVAVRTAVHEMGHVFGLGHTAPGTIMARADYIMDWRLPAHQLQWVRKVAPNICKPAALGGGCWLRVPGADVAAVRRQ